MSAVLKCDDIYDDDTSIVIWSRAHSEQLTLGVADFIKAHPYFKATTKVSSVGAFEELSQLGNITVPSALAESMAMLVQAFCGMFEVKHARLRMVVLDSVMCPRFHTDRVICRLITTYCGPATEWLPHQAVDRSKLGLGNNGLPDHLSGLYQSEDDIRQLSFGDVALLKGTLWPGCKESAQVHRSPVVGPGEKRLVMTLDFVDET